MTDGRIAPDTLGTAGWKLVQGPTARACENAGTGVEVVWTASGPGSRDVAGDASQVADALFGAGYRVGVDRSKAGTVRDVAESDALGSLEFDAQHDADHVVATSACVAGDPADAPTFSPEPPVRPEPR